MVTQNSNVVALKPKALSDDQAAKKLRESGYSEQKHQDTIQKSYDRLLDLGLRPVLLKTGVKAPLGENWLKKEIPARHDFTGYHNIGIITGEAGGGIVDIDIDIGEMIPVMEEFLPKTPFKFGRYYGTDELKLSHWLYRVKDCGPRYNGAKRPNKDSYGKLSAIEVRCDGSQTMAPGSTIIDHELGYILDSVRWEGGTVLPPDSPIPEYTRDYLIRCVNVADVTYFASQYFQKGQFHNDMLYWCGFLMSAGVEDELIEKSIRYIVRVTGQEGLNDRLAAIKTTRDRYEQGEKIAGISYLYNTDHWPKAICKWMSEVMKSGQKDLTDSRPAVRIIASKEPQWLDLTLNAMVETGKFYQTGGQACVVTQQDGKASIVTLDKTVSAASWLTREIHFVQGIIDKATGVITDQNIKCPTSLAQEIAEASTFKGGLPQLNGVSNTPLITPQGRVIEHSWEYDPELKLFFSCEFPLQPMYHDEALPILLDVLCDFPFLSQRYRAAALSALLTAVIRPVLDICPLHVITSSQYSDGKSVLSGVIAAIVGVEASMGQLTRGGSDEEQEKQLSAILSRGRRVVTLDNHDGEFRSAALTEALTSTHPEFRVLGKNETRSVPNKTMFLVNGVNTLPAQDLQTRSVFIKLARTSLDPNRKFKYADVQGYVYDNRARLVSAAISLMRHAMTLEDGNWKPNHRFKQWDYMVRRTVLLITGQDVAPPQIEDAERPMDVNEEARINFLEWLFKLWESGLRNKDSKSGKYFRAVDISDIIGEGSKQEGWLNTLSKRRLADMPVKVGSALQAVKEFPFEVETIRGGGGCEGGSKQVFRLVSYIVEKKSAYRFESLTC